MLSTFSLCQNIVGGGTNEEWANKASVDTRAKIRDVLRVGFAYIMFKVASAVVTVFLSSTLALTIIPLAISVCAVLLYPQEDTIAMVLNIWENVKY